MHARDQTDKGAVHMLRPHSKPPAFQSNRRKSKSRKLVDLARLPYTQYGVGVVQRNPKRCLRCGQPIRRGQPWSKHTSAADPALGAYSVIVHASGR